MEQENESIKIKEDAIKVQVNDLQDTIKSVDSETTKSSFVLGFGGVLFGLVYSEMNELLAWQAIIFTLLLLLVLVVALWNISSQKIRIHIKVDDIFVGNPLLTWEGYLLTPALGMSAPRPAIGATGAAFGMVREDILSAGLNKFKTFETSGCLCRS